MKINDKFGTKKMKYLVDRNKQAKDWNSKHSGGKHCDEIDEVLRWRNIVALQNVQEAGSVSEESDIRTTSNNASVECG